MSRQSFRSPAWSTEHTPSISEFAEFADALRVNRLRSELLVRQALRRASARDPNAPAELKDLSRELEGALVTIDTAAEEMRVQNEALFAARMELEGTSALFRDLFELAPTAYLVTTVETRIIYANEAASALLGVAKNVVAGKLLSSSVALEDRQAFRSGILRAIESDPVCTWPARLSVRGIQEPVNCRLRVRSVATSGVQTRGTLYWNITEEPDEDLI